MIGMNLSLKKAIRVMPDKITIMDGGMGRLLKQIGAPFQQPEWSALSLMEAPHFVTEAHDAFIEAGAEIIITNSYAVVPFHIGQDRFDKQGHALIELSAQIAKDCADKADGKVLVAGSIPPAFGSYRPDLYDDEKAASIYTPMIDAQKNYVDVWLAETVSTTRETQRIKSLLPDDKKPFWVAYTVTDRQDSSELPSLRSGETIAQAVKVAEECQADAILFNCSQPEEMTAVLKIIQDIGTTIQYGVYANVFEASAQKKDANEDFRKMRADNSPERYLEFAREWQNLGATIIGGCCGIMPEHIQKLSEINK